MITKNYAKLIQSLQKKKFRQKYNLFLVEGVKSVRELIDSYYEIDSLFFTQGNWKTLWHKSEPISLAEMQRISLQQSPQEVLAVVRIPECQKFEETYDLVLVLDQIRDPGNLGTIIRMADWFGVKKILCSKDCVDIFSPKVIQSTMASFLSVQVFYEDLAPILAQSKLPVFGAFLEGRNIYEEQLPKSGYIIMGNEAKGVSLKLEDLVTTKLTIPHFKEQKTAESLNVAMATSIILSEWKRRIFS